MLDVLCSEMELGEYGEVLSIGDVVRRIGARRPGDWFGTGLDDVDHWFDRYVGVVGTGAPIVIAGEVDAIAAVYQRFGRRGDGTWGPIRGSAWIEPLTSTAATRRPPRRFGAPPREGDESHWGWRITLLDVEIEPWRNAPAG